MKPDSVLGRSWAGIYSAYKPQKLHSVFRQSWADAQGGLNEQNWVETHSLVLEIWRSNKQYGLLNRHELLNPNRTISS